ncbi:MAG: HD domain-containing protein [Deltaproteobacteria bacterium]|nr:HD domain-containing protein [Deltaproteobacteria bacterium]
MGILRDVTERKAAEEQNKLHLEQLASLHSIDMAISSSHDILVTLEVILRYVIEQLKVDAADILLYKPHLQILQYASGYGFRTQALKHTNLKIGESHAGMVALKREVIHIADLREDDDGFKRSSQLREEGFISYYGIPLIGKGEVKGVMEVFHRTNLDPGQEWLNFLNTLAGQAAIAIDNAILFDGLQHSNIELTMAYDETIEGWSRALDLRDKETEGHSKRVTELTLKIAGAIGISEAEQAEIRRGALLHDIGKMGIPDRILLKPGPLDETELTIMRKHPVFAYELLSAIKFLKTALNIPYCHHEKWDGSGYPRGLTGEQIPLSARIFALADIFDALSSDRPYRPAWSKGKVLDHIRSLSGNHLDPKIVEEFFKMDWKTLRCQ